MSFIVRIKLKLRLELQRTRIASADFLESKREGPQILIGHSLGGAAVLQAAGRIPSSRCVVTIGAPSEPSHVARLLRGSREES